MWEFFKSVLGTGAVAAALLGIAGYLGRSQLAHWLNKDIERIKAEHQLELEAYKVSLIAQAERSKAQQDLKRTAALKFLEMEFEALRELHGASLGLSAAIGGTAHLNKDDKTPEAWKKALEKYERMVAACNAIGPFVSPVVRGKLHEYRTALFEVQRLCAPQRDRQPPEVLDPMVKRLVDAEVAVDGWVAARITELRALD